MTAFVPRLLVLLIQSTGLLLLGLLALRLTRRFGPSVQSLVGRASLVGVALLLLLAPLTGHVQPVVRVPEPTPVRSSPIRSNPLADTLPKREGEEVRSTAVGVPPAAPSVRAGDVPAPAASISPPYTNLPPKPVAPSETPRPPAPGGQALVPGGFLSISALLLLWLGICQWHLTRLRRSALAITTGPAATLLAELTPNPPRLLSHPSVHSPFLAGYRRPVIFLPMTYAADFGADALRAIFVHELAHRDRCDNLWTLAARLLTALLWPQPLLWLLVRKLEHISEDACDQAVLARSCPPRAYADCLLSLVTRPSGRRERALSAGVAPFRSSIGCRISRILTTQGNRPMTPITLRLRLTAAALTVAAALCSAFLVSSAPAQTTAPMPSVPTPQLLQYCAEQKQDLQNLKAIGSAITLYIQDHNERMPDAAHWMDQIASYHRDPNLFFDPFQPGKHRYAYAFNRNCSSKTMMVTQAPAETVIVFDSTLGTRNASDTGQSLRTTPPRPSNLPFFGSNYLFIDGHPKFFRQGVRPSFSLEGGQPSASSTLLTRQEILRHLTAELSKYIGDKPLKVMNNAPVDQASLLASLTPVQGPGVVVTLTDSKKKLPTSMPVGMAPPNIIHDSDINQVVNELRAAGAEAIAVNNQRLVVTSAIRSAGPTILVNNAPQTPPYVIKAIGDPKTLTLAMNLPGGVATQLKAFDPAMFTVQQATTLTLPAYTSSGVPRYARPVGSAASIADRPHLRRQVAITLDSRGQYFVDGSRINKSRIEPRLADLARQDSSLTAVIQANENQPYSRVVELVDLVKQAGIQSMQITRW